MKILILALLLAFPAQADHGLCVRLLSGSWFGYRQLKPEVRPLFEATTPEEKAEALARVERVRLSGQNLSIPNALNRHAFETPLDPLVLRYILTRTGKAAIQKFYSDIGFSKDDLAFQLNLPERDMARFILPNGALAIAALLSYHAGRPTTPEEIGISFGGVGILYNAVAIHRAISDRSQQEEMQQLLHVHRFIQGHMTLAPHGYIHIRRKVAFGTIDILLTQSGTDPVMDVIATPKAAGHFDLSDSDDGGYFVWLGLSDHGDGGSHSDGDGGSDGGDGGAD